MVTRERTGRWPLGRAAAAGVGVGSGVLVVWLVAGVAFASWSVADFVAHLDPETIGWLAVAGGAAVATVAVPVGLFLWRGFVAPLAVLGVVVLGWVVLGANSGVLFTAPFGLTLYVVLLAPLYLVAYAVGSAAEYYLRRAERE